MLPSPSNRIRVLLVDDQRMFADALAALLELDPRVSVVGVASTPDEALAAAPGADVALVDLVMPTVDGCELTVVLRAAQPALRVVLVSGRADEQIAEAADAAGAVAFLRKGSLGAEVGDVIVDAAAAPA